MVQPTYPGVYIEEFTPASPIEGVSTNIAAFLGPCSSGPINEPKKITSWDEFQRQFGNPLDGFYLWYAVRGFFRNGGTVCYVARVSNARFGEVLLPDDDTGAKTIRIRACKAGGASANLSVAVEHLAMVSGAKLYRPDATITDASGSTIIVSDADDAAKFRSGDQVTWNGSAEISPVIIARVDGKNIRVVDALSGNYNAGALRLADYSMGQTTLRLEDAAEVAAGCVLKLTQGAAGNQTIETGRIVKRVTVERISVNVTTYRVELRNALTQTLTMNRNTAVESAEFNLKIKKAGNVKVYPMLGMDSDHPNYFARVVGADASADVIAEPFGDPPDKATPPDNRPAEIALNAAQSLSAGSDDAPATLTGADYKLNLALLEKIDEVSLVAIPDRFDADVQTAVIEHCKAPGRWDRFAILHSRPRAPLFGSGSVEEQRLGVIDEDGFAALYYPWLRVSNATGTDTILVPPCGHVAGVYARNDGRRGVHKAPAGTEATVEDALSVETSMSDIEQGQLNLSGVDVIRVFSTGGRPVVWGARTTAKDNKNWRYVNVRRLFLFLEESIQEGIRTAVFEPNNQSLWQKLKRTITAFLVEQWRAGALFGAKQEEAFYVRIDEAINPASEQALGRLYIEIGVRPSYPAEFIIVRIGIWQGGSEISEG